MLVGPPTIPAVLFLGGSNSARTPDTNAVQSALLQPTFENALRTSFYQSLWSGIDVEEVTLASLDKLPLVTKSSIRRAGREAQNRKGVVCTEILTKGSTGHPLITVKGDRERQFVREFFRQLAPRQQMRRRGLRFKDHFHGTHVIIPSHTHWHSLSAYDFGGFAYGRQVLADSSHNDHRVDRLCSVMLGGGPCLRAFTLDTRRVANEGRRWHLERICTVGEYLTGRWRHLLRATWHAPVVDRFSLSEVFGGATGSPLCGWWHFDFCVLPEVVDTYTGRPITEGVGQLVLTTLYPFQEAQPLVRYATGDLVEVTHTQSSRPGSLAIVPLGRIQCSVPMPRCGQWALTEASIIESLDSLETAARAPLLLDAEQVKDPYAIGMPKYRLHCEPAGSSIRIELTAVLSSATEAISDLRRSILQSLCYFNKRLSDQLARGIVQLDVQFEMED